jgi:hypothetical protein
MALSAAKTWVAGEVLFASDLNAEFSNIYTNGEDLHTPATKAHDMDGFELIVDADGDSSITSDTDDRLDMRLQAVDCFRFDGSVGSVANGLDFTASATGVDVAIAAQGTDSNIDVDIQGKGTGIILANGDNTFDPIANQVFAS